MAMRFVALLIPLAITLPQLQTSRPKVPEPQPSAVPAQLVNEPEAVRETPHVADASVKRVTFASSQPEAAPTLDSEPVDTPAAAAVPTVAASEARSATPERAAPKPARTASPVKLVAAHAAPGRTIAGAATRKMKPLLAANAGCPPNVHCAPVVVAKITPVIRRPL